MAKKETRTARGNEETAMTGRPRGGGDTMERRVAAFAEQLGRVVGTIQARTGALRDNKALSTQIARVRDGASHLLEQLAGGKGAPRASKTGTKATRRPAATRSRGPVDAPGKRHRKMPANPDAHLAGSQEAKLLAAKPMAKTKRQRIRG